MKTVEFGTLEDARSVRNKRQFNTFLADADSGREKTVRLKDSVPESALREIRGEAAESRQFERQRAGQISLTDDERTRIDFSREGVNVPKVRSIKGIAANEGVDDFLAFADLDLTVDENRSLLKRAKREERGQRMDATEDENKQIDKAARAYQAKKQSELPRAKRFGFEGDEEAQSFVRSQGSLGEVFNISFTRVGDRIRGRGQDYERLEEQHESRPQRAQTVDERRSAKTTRDPFEWSNNPNQYDFPGIDTVQPQELHEQRSERAQRADEREVAPFADTKEQWANNTDTYDWPGVDTPDAAESLSEGERRAGVPFDTLEADDESIEQEFFSGMARSADVSLTPGEALRGEAATSSRSIGGFKFRVQRETDRPEREATPPGMNLQEPDTLF
jgi:hypothetical protein